MNILKTVAFFTLLFLLTLAIGTLLWMWSPYVASGLSIPLGLIAGGGGFIYALSQGWLD